MQEDKHSEDSNNRFKEHSKSLCFFLLNPLVHDDEPPCCKRFSSLKGYGTKSPLRIWTLPLTSTVKTAIQTCLHDTPACYKALPYQVWMHNIHPFGKYCPYNAFTPPPPPPQKVKKFNDIILCNYCKDESIIPSPHPFNFAPSMGTTKVSWGWLP